MGFLKLITYNRIKNGSNKERKKFIKNKNLIKISKILSIILQIIENYFYFLRLISFTRAVCPFSPSPKKYS